MNLKNPNNINEKIQFLKLNDYNNNDIITMCVDKYRVREYLDMNNIKIKSAKLYNTYDKVEDIDWKKLPKSFVIKCNHGCGYNLIVTDKNKLSITKAKKTIKKWMKENFYKRYAEIQYKYVKKKIIIEEYLGDIKTYKFYCFNGIPKVMYISNNEIVGDCVNKDKYLDFFDMNFNHLEYLLDGHPNYPGKIAKPKNFEKMISYSKKLSKNFPFVRIDLYDVEGEIYLSEYTFVPTGGYMKFQSNEVLYEWGKWLDISGKKGVKK